MTDHQRTITGHDAIAYVEQHGGTLCKYADPTEPACDDITIDAAREIAAQDPSLVYLTMDTEPLTPDMIHELHTEARSAGDAQMSDICERALKGSAAARQSVATAINAARGMDDSRPFVRVIP